MILTPESPAIPARSLSIAFILSAALLVAASAVTHAQVLAGGITSNEVRSTSRAIGSRGAPTTGRLIGTVTDINDARVAGVHIVVTSQNFTRTATTSEDGTYLVELPGGTYRIKITGPGFCPLHRAPFQIQTSTTATFNFALIPCAISNDLIIQNGQYRGETDRYRDPFEDEIFPVKQKGAASLELMVRYAARRKYEKSIEYHGTRVSYDEQADTPAGFERRSKSVGVTVSCDWVTIQADRVRLYPDDLRIEATGNVVLDDGKQRTTAKTVKLEFLNGKPIIKGVQRNASNSIAGSTLTAGASTSITQLDSREHVYQLRGRAVDETGRPMPDALVFLDFGGEGCTNEAISVNPDGFFRTEESTGAPKPARRLYVTGPIPDGAVLLALTPFNQYPHLDDPAFAGQQVLMKENDEVNVGDARVQRRYQRVTLHLVDDNQQPVLTSDEKWEDFWLRLRDAKGTVIESTSLSNKDVDTAVSFKNSSIVVAVPEGTWFIDASLNGQHGPWITPLTSVNVTAAGTAIDVFLKIVPQR